jgi:4-amino-4-deoxy-L-arabinose transferase-like glycosyltransferase
VAGVLPTTRLVFSAHNYPGYSYLHSSDKIKGILILKGARIELFALYDNPKRILFSIVVLSVLLRLAFIGVMRWRDFDDQEEGMIARSLLIGQGYSLNGQPTAHKPPAYTLLLAACLLPFRNEWTPLDYDPSKQYNAHLLDQILKAATAGLTVLVLFKLGQRVLNTPVASLAALFYAANPLLIVQLIFPGHMVYDMLLFTSLLLFYLRLVEVPSSRRALALGLLMGITLMVNPAIVAFILLAHAWVFFIGLRRQSLAVRLRILILSLFVAALMTAPWAVRNFQVFHQFVPFTSNQGLELWFGNNPLATGGFYQGPQPKVEGLDLAQLNEIQHNQALRDEAVDYILRHPVRTIELRIRSLYYFWFGTWQFSRFPAIVTRLWFWGNASLVCLSLAGLALLAWKERRKSVLPLLLVIGLVLPYLVTHSGDDRYRAGLSPLLMLSLAYLVWRGYQALRLFTPAKY